MRMRSCRRAPATLEVQVTVTLSPSSTVSSPLGSMLTAEYTGPYKVYSSHLSHTYCTIHSVKLHTVTYINTYVYLKVYTHQHSEREHIQTQQAQYTHTCTHTYIRIRTCMYVCTYVSMRARTPCGPDGVGMGGAGGEVEEAAR